MTINSKSIRGIVDCLLEPGMVAAACNEFFVLCYVFKIICITVVMLNSMIAAYLSVRSCIKKAGQCKKVMYCTVCTWNQERSEQKESMLVLVLAELNRSHALELLVSFVHSFPIVCTIVSTLWIFLNSFQQSNMAGIVTNIQNPLSASLQWHLDLYTVWNWTKSATEHVLN